MIQLAKIIANTVCIGLFLSHLSYAQNLINNPSFEDYTQLPETVAEYNYCTEWNNVSVLDGVDEATPDYFHTLSVSDFIQLPETIWGYIEPNDGEAIVGMALWLAAFQFREYISQDLSEELVVGNCYSLSFFISNSDADNVNEGEDIHAGAAISEIGIYFSEEQPIQTGYQPIDVAPQLLIEEVLYTEEWIEFQFDFIADAPYKYMTIGNFNNDGNTEYEIIVPSSTDLHAYYFFDNFELIEIGSEIVINGPTHICEGDADLLTAEGDDNFLWADASSPDQIIAEGNTLVVSPTVNTTYLAYGTKDTASWTIDVAYLSTIDLGPNQQLCQGDTLILYPTNGGSTITTGPFLWSDGSTEPTLEVTGTGIYSVQIGPPGCQVVDTMEVQFINIQANLGPDQLICEGNSLLLDPSPWDGIYTWQDGSSSSTLLVESGGIYWVELNVNDCISRDTIVITQQNLPTLEVEGRTSLCSEDEKILEFMQKLEDIEHTIYNNTTNEYLTSITQTGDYVIEVSDDLCEYDQSYELSVYNCDACQVQLPTAFSPNNDGVNDEFRVLYNSDCIILSQSLMLYDRWGKLLFQSNNIDNGWDGSLNGQLLPLGVYVYFAQFEFETPDGIEKMHRQGNVTIVR